MVAFPKEFKLINRDAIEGYLHESYQCTYEFLSLLINSKEEVLESQIDKLLKMVIVLACEDCTSLGVLRNALDQEIVEFANDSYLNFFYV